MMRGWPIRADGWAHQMRLRSRGYALWMRDLRLRMLTGRRVKALRPLPAWKPWRWQRG